MKSWIVVALAAFAGCSHSRVQETATPVPDLSSVNVESPFADKAGCFLLYDVKSKRVVKQLGNDDDCKRQLVPCSTFKVAAAVMGFDSGILKDETTTFKWDGKKRFVDSWNQDLTAAEWIKYSAVWYTQRLTPQLGLAKIKKYLAGFQYGNQDFSSGLVASWLTANPTEKSRTEYGSLKISAVEQLEFMKKLWAGTLPVSKHAIELTKKVTLLETSPGGYVLHGKTGSGYLDAEYSRRLGWFVSHLQGPAGEFIAITNFTDSIPNKSKGFAGMEAKEITRSLYKELGLW